METWNRASAGKLVTGGKHEKSVTDGMRGKTRRKPGKSRTWCRARESFGGRLKEGGGGGALARGFLLPSFWKNSSSLLFFSLFCQMAKLAKRSPYQESLKRE